MKFYFNGGIWDAEKNKLLCEAIDGIYETEDKKIIDKLLLLNIPTDEKIEEKNKGIKVVETKTEEPIKKKRRK